MSKQLLVALWLFAAMGVGVAFFVWMTTKTIPVVTRAYDAGALIARRGELLKRGDNGTRLAFRTGDAGRTTEYLGRVARTFIGAGEWRSDPEA